MQSFQQNQLIFLTDKNFAIGNGTKGKLLFNDLQGLSMVLIYSTNCPVCHQVMPIFKELPSYVQGCKFALINIDNNKEIVSKSQLTTMPIKYVPQFICFNNGKPFIKYTGEKKLDILVSFCKDIVSRVHQSVNFSKPVENKVNDSDYESGMPYNIVCDSDSDMCYLTDGELATGKEDNCDNGQCCYLNDCEL